MRHKQMPGTLLLSDLSVGEGGGASLPMAGRLGISRRLWRGLVIAGVLLVASAAALAQVSGSALAKPVKLTVSVVGPGSVTSSPTGIDCGATCSAEFVRGSQVTLIATPASGATFKGWSGACTGRAACIVTMNTAARVKAVFEPNSVIGACPVTTTTVASASGVQLALNVSRNSGVAPLAVFFDTSGTSATSAQRPFHDLEYRWRFGDAASGTWAYGAKAGAASRNQAMGPMAAHVFNAAGTYTVAVSAFDGTSTLKFSCNITVQAAEAEFAAEKTICISGLGSFAGCPAGAQQVSDTNPSRAVANHIGMGNKRILFARGETFNVANTILINKAGPGLIGAFGTGAKPRFVNTVSTGTFALSSMETPSVSDWRLTDLQVDGGGFEGNSVAVYAAGAINHTLISRLDIQNLNSGIKFSGSTLDAINDSGFTSPMWDGVFITDTRVNNLTGVGATGGNGFYLTGWRMAVMGNAIDNNLGGEHGMRSAYSDRSVWQHNTTRRVARAHMTLRASNQGGSTLAAQLPGLVYTQKLLASENQFIGGPEAHAFGGTGPTNAVSNGRAREQIWEKNLMLGGAGTNGFFTITGSEVSVRNNILFLHPDCHWSSLGVGPYDTAYALAQGIPQPTNVWFLHNTIYAPATSPFFLSQLIGDPLTNSEITYKNNLLYSPNNGASQDGLDWIYNPNRTTLHRVPVEANTLIAELQAPPLFTADPPSAAAHVKPLAGSYAIGRGTPLAVWSDYFGTPLATGARDLGAVKH